MTSKRKKEIKGIEEVNHSLNKIIKGAGIFFIGLVIGKILGYFYVMFVARLGTEQFGLLNLGLSIVSLLTIVSLLGLDNGILRYVSYFSAKGDNRGIKGSILSSLKICFPISIFLALVMFAFSTQISTIFFHNLNLAPILRIFSIMIPFSVVSMLFYSSFRAFQRVEYEVGLREILEKAIRLLLSVIFIYLGFKVLGATYAYVISAVIIFIFVTVILNKLVFPIFTTKIKARDYSKELLSFSLPLMFVGVLISIIVWIDTLMLGYFRTVGEVGIYNAANPTAALMFIIPTALISLFLPIITNFYSQKKFSQIKHIYKSVSRWIFFVNFPIFIIITVFSRQILRIIFGNEYMAGALALSLLVCGHLFYSLSYTSANILYMAKKTRIVFNITLIFAASHILFGLILIPKYGINGASFAALLSFLLASFLNIFFSYKKIKVYPFDKSFFKSMASGILATGVVYYTIKFVFKSLSPIGLSLMFVVLLLIYIALLFLFKSFRKEDIEVLKIIMGKLRLPSKLKLSLFNL